MTLEEDHLLRLMIAENALIDLSNPGDIYPAFPRGDRRKRPIFWIETYMVDRLVALGGLERHDGKARLTKRMRVRLSNGHTEQGGPHRDMDEQDIYMPSGSTRPARVNHRASPLRSLARKCTASGEPLLSKAQVEAGEQFAKDYTLGGLGFAATQSFATERVDGSQNPDQQELALISRMDRRKRAHEAISCLGQGLDKAVIAVCCDGYSTEHLERTEKWVKNSGRTVLALALNRLVAFYGTVPGQR